MTVFGDVTLRLERDEAYALETALLRAGAFETIAHPLGRALLKLREAL